ncbi:MAG: insulinase family protein [Gemmatimonadota bacterium]
MPIRPFFRALRTLPSLALLAAGMVPVAVPVVATAQRPVPTMAGRDSTAPVPIPADSAVRSGRLPNGLRYYVRRNARPEQRVELRLVVNAGSVLEDADQRGLAHFTEHMLFNGTRRFKKNDIVSYLESIGVKVGADLNAYTGFDETVYILPVPTDKPGLLDRSFDILEDWAGGVLFDSSDVVGERGVVLEEWRGGLGADTRIRDKQFPVIFAGSKYADRLPIGLPEVIRGANPAALKRFYHEWYRPDNMAVVAVGDVDPARLVALIRQHFSGMTAPARARARPSIAVPPNDSTLVSIATDPELQYGSVEVLYKHPAQSLHTVADYRRSVVGRLYNLMLNQRLTEITRRPDAPFAFAGSAYGSFVRSTDVYQLQAAAKDGALLDALRAVLIEARRVDQHGFLESELDRARTAILRSYESANAERDKTESASYVEEYVDQFLTGDAAPGIAWEYAEVQRLLPGVTVGEVNALARQWITDQNRVVAISAPTKDSASVPSKAAVLATFRAANAAAVEPYTETVSTAALVANVPPPGHIVAESTTTELGVTTWTLSNGARVVLKPTDFKADEVMMRAWSPGGSSLVSDADYPSAILATTVVERGGLGDFDLTSLGKKLTGKQARANAYVDVLEEGISGGASTKDLETLFQLAYLRFTAPRRDTSAFLAFKAQIAPFFANRANSPDAVFSDTILLTMAQHHPRAQPITQALLDRASYDRALEIYHDRFADASDFTFVFVGSFSLEQMRPLVEQWLATLPATHRNETWRDVGIRPPAGVIEKTVRKGVEPKASSIVVFSGDAPYTPATRYALRSLSEYLEMRLLDNLREALGGTYSVNVGGQASQRPQAEYSVTIQFGSAPGRADSLFRTVLAVIDSTKAGVISDADVQKVREQQQRSFEVNQRENSYWLANLAGRLESGEDPRGLLTYDQLIHGLTAAQLQRAAQDFLDVAHYARFVLLPTAVQP